MKVSRVIYCACIGVMASVSTAWAEETDLMLCTLSNEGTVRLAANEQKQLNLYFDETAQSVLGVARALNLDTALDMVHYSDKDGPIDFMESGNGYYSSGGTCGIGLDFAQIGTRGQPLGEGRRILLKESGNDVYKMVDCGDGKQLSIVSCVASSKINSVYALKRYLPTVLGD